MKLFSSILAVFAMLVVGQAEAQNCPTCPNGICPQVQMAPLQYQPIRSAVTAVRNVVTAPVRMVANVAETNYFAPVVVANVCQCGCPNCTCGQVAAVAVAPPAFVYEQWEPIRSYGSNGTYAAPRVVRGVVVGNGSAGKRSNTSFNAPGYHTHRDPITGQEWTHSNSNQGNRSAHYSPYTGVYVTKRVRASGNSEQIYNGEFVEAGEVFYQQPTIQFGAYEASRFNWRDRVQTRRENRRQGRMMQSIGYANTGNRSFPLLAAIAPKSIFGISF